MRRLLIEEPASRAAMWSRRVGAFAWLSMAVALLLARFERLLPYEALAAVIACGALAAVAMALAILAFGSTWRSGARGVPSALTGLLLGVALLAYPVGVSLRDLISPPALDLTTDPLSPPQPLTPLKQLPRGAPPPAVASINDAGARRPIAPSLIDRRMDDALTLTWRAAILNSWHITDVDYPRAPPYREARFSATVPSPLIHWPSDAIVRLQQTEEGVRVDVRLVARERWSLLRGGDADIQGFFERIEALLQPP
ncbi:Protein of unknown function [Rhizobiales bacterium GAS188]|nr:Protein of unknown function [Rhizobiales bacterium GAS188]